jgi:hypothetical protein
MRIMFYILLTVVLLGGCATAKKTYTSEGKEGHSINCSGTYLNWGLCFEKAGEICGSKGYEVLEKSSDKGAMVSGNQFGLYGSSVINRTMIIQ